MRWKQHKVDRVKATWLVGLIIFAISATISLNFDSLFGFVITLTTERAQPLLSMVLCIFAGWVFYRNSILQELKQGSPMWSRVCFGRFGRCM